MSHHIPYTIHHTPYTIHHTPCLTHHTMHRSYTPWYASLHDTITSWYASLLWDVKEITAHLADSKGMRIWGDAYTEYRCRAGGWLCIFMVHVRSPTHPLTHHFIWRYRSWGGGCLWVNGFAQVRVLEQDGAAGAAHTGYILYATIHHTPYTIHCWRCSYRVLHHTPCTILISVICSYQVIN
jgi:hypothetical protein